nr:hypothetical protein L204_04584 [Cryptococcus depauperatus CBS 7855]
MVSSLLPTTTQKQNISNVRFHPPSQKSDHPSTRTRIRSPPPRKRRHHHLHHNPRAMLRAANTAAQPTSVYPLDIASWRQTTPLDALPPPMNVSEKTCGDPHPSIYWRDYYAPLPLGDDHVVPKPTSKIKLYNTKWQSENPNPKTAAGMKALYGSGMPMGGMYGGMGPGMYGGMYGGMGMGMPMGMGMGGMGGMGGMMGGYGADGCRMYDPMMGTYGAPPAANFVDDNPDAHRIEHAYRQSMPDSYGTGMGMLPGGMGINSMPGSQVLLYGRGMPYNGWYA